MDMARRTTIFAGIALVALVAVWIRSAGTVDRPQDLLVDEIGVGYDLASSSGDGATWTKVFVDPEGSTITLGVLVDGDTDDAIRRTALSLGHAEASGVMVGLDSNGRGVLDAEPGVVVSEASGSEGVVRMAVYVEGTHGYVVLGGGATGDAVDRALAVQLEHSVGERAEFRLDEPERRAAEPSGRLLDPTRVLRVLAGLLVVVVIIVAVRTSDSATSLEGAEAPESELV